MYQTCALSCYANTIALIFEPPGSEVKDSALNWLPAHEGRCLSLKSILEGFRVRESKYLEANIGLGVSIVQVTIHRSILISLRMGIFIFVRECFLVGGSTTIFIRRAHLFAVIQLAVFITIFTLAIPALGT